MDAYRIFGTYIRVEGWVELIALKIQSNLIEEPNVITITSCESSASVLTSFSKSSTIESQDMLFWVTYEICLIPSQNEHCDALHIIRVPVKNPFLYLVFQDNCESV
jgi:hypothetical protein